jgi:hypothetical protein
MKNVKNTGMSSVHSWTVCTSLAMKVTEPIWDIDIVHRICIYGKSLFKSKNQHLKYKQITVAKRAINYWTSFMRTGFIKKKILNASFLIIAHLNNR